MASFNKITLFMVATMVIFMTTTTKSTEAQGIPSCAQKLIPCADYLNSTTKPPETCCGPIKEAVQKELNCLCNLYKTPGLLQSFGINVTQALQLTTRCGVKADLTACSPSTSADAPTSTTAAVPPPPGVPGNDGVRMAWTGFSSLILMLAAFLTY